VSWYSNAPQVDWQNEEESNGHIEKDDYSSTILKKLDHIVCKRDYIDGKKTKTLLVLDISCSIDKQTNDDLGLYHHQ
jgi:hypothetical protein